MMISPMLPTVAFMIPPILGPAEMPSCSVAWPRRYARARIVSAATPKVRVGSAFSRRSARDATVPIAETANAAISTVGWYLREVVEMRGLEPLTPAMRTRCSPS